MTPHDPHAVGASPRDARIERAESALRDTVAALREAGIVPAALARFVPARRVLGIIPRRERVRATGEGWRLGTLIITSDGELVIDATTTRSRRPERVGYTAESARERDALRHAAYRGGFVEGVTVHVGGRVVDGYEPGAGCSSDASSSAAGELGPLVLRPDTVAVRWAAGTPAAAAIPLDRYLAEHAALLIEPPERAT